MEYVNTVSHEIYDMRNSMDITFSKMFKKAKNFINSIDEEKDIKYLGLLDIKNIVVMLLKVLLKNIINSYSFFRRLH